MLLYIEQVCQLFYLFAYLIVINLNSQSRLILRSIIILKAINILILLYNFELIYILLFQRWINPQIRWNRWLWLQILFALKRLWICNITIVIIKAIAGLTILIVPVSLGCSWLYFECIYIRVVHFWASSYFHFIYIFVAFTTS